MLYYSQGLLPMQLMAQIPSDLFDSFVFTAAQESDVLLRVDRSVSGTNTIRLTSYEWNESKFQAF